MLKNLSNISIRRIILFYSIAIVGSNLFRLDVWGLKESLQLLPIWLHIPLLVVLEGSGVLIGALTALWMLSKHRKREITFWGSSKTYSILMAIIPMILVTMIGVNSEGNLNAHIYGFIAIVGSLLYCIMEEYGWRGYLQEELRGMKPWKKYALIGFLWYLWHLSFVSNSSIGNNLFFLILLIFGSWGIGQIAEVTQSIMASACFHLIVQIMMLNPLIRNGINGTQKIIILASSVVLWVIIVKKWEKKEVQVEAT